MNNETKLERSFIFYVATLLFFGVGAITTIGLDWYTALSLPWWTPPELLVAAVWFVLFLCTAFSVSIFWEQSKKGGVPSRYIVSLYVLNSFLVLLWSYLFFGVHELGFAFGAALAVGLSVVVLMLRLWKGFRNAALLLLPYVGWMLFALAYTYTVMVMNA